MAFPKTLQGHKILIQIGDGATPTEAFAAYCGMVNANLSFTSSVQENAVPDCADPAAPMWLERSVDTLGVTISGDGTLDTKDALPAWWEWFTSAEAKNIRVKVDAAPADGGGYWAGSFVLTSLELGGQRKQNSTISVEFQSNGVVTWTDAV
jgi:predicted secreted protein